MLRPSRALAFAIIIMASVGCSGPAFAGPIIPPKPKGDYRLICLAGVCTWIASSYVHNAGDETSTDHPPKTAAHTKPVCQFGGAAQACTDSELGNWSNSQQCYMKREDPPPPPGDPRWEGHTDGSIWA